MDEIETIKQSGSEEGLQSLKDICMSGQGVYRISNKDSCFTSTQRYNPLMELATVVETDGESLEFPLFNLQNNGWGEDPTSKMVENNSFLNLRLYPIYAKLKMSRILYSKVKAFDNYVKNQLFLQLDNLLREFLLVGERADEGAHQFAPIGLVNEVNNQFNINLNGAHNAVNSILRLIASLPSMYQFNAKFILSNSTLHKLNVIRQNCPQLLFDGISKLFGHEIVVMDEIGDDHILFGDFKQAVVIAVNDSNNIECHRGFDSPNYVGLSMPTSVGLGIINQDAIICGVLLDESEDENKINNKDENRNSKLNNIVDSEDENMEKSTTSNKSSVSNKSYKKPKTLRATEEQKATESKGWFS